ncbi:MAG: TRAM domain-containing protein [Chlamydiales bacterium]|nr:TRAM domain-containing protein [Chlamydiales bacterium]
MKLSVAFVRNFFLVLSVLFVTAFVINTNWDLGFTNKLLLGVGGGLAFGVVIALVGRIFERFNLRMFNLAALGLLFGYLMGQAILLVFEAVLGAFTTQVDAATLGLIRTLVFLSSIYVSMIFAVRAAEEISLSIPFVQFNQDTKKKKDILADSSILLDSRIIDVVASGLVDNYLIIPRFILSDLHMQSESEDESVKARARRALEVIKKMEGMSALGLRFTDTDLPDIKDPVLKLIRIARMLDANILTADISRIQQSEVEGVRIVNIHSLANSLKPVAQAGEYIHIKIQRYGKEPRQGVGYLEDGTMVVINGGAEFIGETIRARVLSVKHTSSGRMIFCNTAEEWAAQEGAAAAAEAAGAAATSTQDSASKKYFSV